MSILHAEDLLRKSIIDFCKDSWLDMEDIYYSIKYLNVTCKDVENKLISQENLILNNDYVDRLNDEIVDEIYDYTDVEYVTINRELRSETKTQDFDVNEYMEFVKIGNIIKALDNAPKIDRTFYVFRQTIDFDLDNGKSLSDLRPGDTFIDQGIMSSSWKSSYVSGTSNCCILIIKIANTMKYLSVESISKKKENEILTYPGMEYRINHFRNLNFYDYTEMKSLTVKIFECEIIGNYWNQAWSGINF